MNNKVKIEKFSKTIEKITLTDKQRKLISDLLLEMRDLQNKLSSKTDINYTTFLMPLIMKEGESSSLIEGTRTMMEDFAYDYEEMDNIPQWETRNLLNMYEKYIVRDYHSNHFIFSAQTISIMHIELYENDENSKFKMIFDTTKEIKRVAPGIISKDDTKPNFIGPNNNINDASLILLQPSKKEEYLKDMMDTLGNKYKNQELLMDHIVLMHPVFETIHPFNDGNGRIGRLLLALLFKLVLGNFNFPILISEEFAKDKDEYKQKLQNVQLKNDYESWNAWNSYFIECLLNAKKRLKERADKITKLLDQLGDTKAVSTEIRKKILSLFFKFIKLNKEITIKKLKRDFPKISIQTIYKDWKIVVDILEAKTNDEKYYTNAKLLQIIS